MHKSHPKLLDAHSDELSAQIFSKVIVPKETIQHRLNFVYHPENLEEKRVQFSTLYSRITEVINDRSFSIFGDNCQALYDEGDDEMKIAVSMLFESVSDKYYTQFKRLQKVKRMKEQGIVGIARSPLYFGNADKTQPLGYTDSSLGVTTY